MSVWSFLRNFAAEFNENQEFMKKYVFALAAWLLSTLGAFAQTFSEPCIPGKVFTKSIDASVTMGTTGIGVDVALPISEVVKVRTGFSWKIGRASCRERV